MKIRILNIEPCSDSGDQLITAGIKGKEVTLYDPEGQITNDLLKKEVDGKICGQEGTVAKSKGPVKIDGKAIVAKVLENCYEYAVLDCGLFQLDYMTNMGDEEKFEVGGLVKIKDVRLDLVIL